MFRHAQGVGPAAQRLGVVAGADDEQVGVRHLVQDLRQGLHQGVLALTGDDAETHTMTFRSSMPCRARIIARPCGSGRKMVDSTRQAWVPRRRLGRNSRGTGCGRRET